MSKIDNVNLSGLVGQKVKVHNTTGTYSSFKVVGYGNDPDSGDVVLALISTDKNRFGVTFRVLDSSIEFGV